MKTYNEVIEFQREEWNKLGMEEHIPFKNYLDRVQRELKKMNFEPTPQQLDLLLNLDRGSLLVDSTAGSGKTTTVVVKSILDEIVFNVEPYNIIFLTFSKKSAADMQDKRDKYLRRFYNAKNYARMSTLHSMCFKFLDTYSKEPGGLYAFSKKRLIADELVSFGELDNEFDKTEDFDPDDFDDMDFDDMDFYGGSDDETSSSQSKSVIDIMKRFIDEDSSLDYIDNMNEMKNIMSCFSYQKERMLSDKQIVKERIFQSLECEAEDYFKLRDQVEQYKKQFEYFDFTDLELKTLEILREHRDFFYSDNTFKMVFKPIKLYVDEVQDMTPLQKQVIKEFVEIPVDDGRETSLIAIGDGDQRIYSWRGSDTIEFGKFQDVFDPEKNNSQLKIFSKNHRCGANILEKANELIQNNTLRNEKDMESREGDPGKFEVIHYMNSKEMIKSVVQEVVDQVKSEGKESLENTAIIYREHSQVMGIVTALLRLDLPFDLGGMKLPYKHWIFRNLMEICDSLLFDYKEDSVDVVYKFTSLNKKEVTTLKKDMEKLSFDSNEQIGWVDVLRNNMINNKKPMVSKKALVDLTTLRKVIRDKSTSIKQVLQKLYSLYTLHNLGYVLKNLIYVERAEIEAIEYFINSIPKNESYEELKRNINDWDRYIFNYRNMKYGVKMMTMHSTKGLEFNKVMIVGMDSEYSPKESYLKELEGNNQLEYIEEERRLFFVGITRAINECLVYANITNPSRLIPEIDPSVKLNIESKEKATTKNTNIRDNGDKRLEVMFKFKNKTIREELFEEELKCFLRLS